MGRFKRLVESEEAMEKFIPDYRIPSTVGLRYCKEGDWHIMRRGGDTYNRLPRRGYEDSYGSSDEGLL